MLDFRITNSKSIDHTIHFISIAAYINKQGHRIVIERNEGSKMTVSVNGFPFRIEKRSGKYVYWRCVKQYKYQYVYCIQKYARSKHKF